MHKNLPLYGLIVFLGMMFILAGQQAALSSPEGAETAGNHSLYLPLVRKGGSGTAPTATVVVTQPPATATSTRPPATATSTRPPATATATTPPTPQPARSFFLPYEVAGELHNTRSGDIAVDAAGGVHVAYEPSDMGWDEPVPIYYGYCATNCDDQDSFTTIALNAGDDFYNYINLELDAQGRPRLLWQVYSGFRYATCNSGCTNPTNWTISSSIIGQLDSLTDGSNRMLALDSQGRPRFVFNDSSWGDHVGTYYMACDSNCTQPANWRQARISEEEYIEPSLSLTSSGMPRVAFKYTDTEGDYSTHFGYMACDAACDSAQGQWSMVLMEEVDTFYSNISLRLDSQNRPRVALYSGPIDEGGDLEPETTYYVWCNSNCASPQSAVWGKAPLPLVGEVYHFSTLALDSQGRPRIAYSGDNGIRYAWCNTNCTSGSGIWTETLLDNEDVLDQTDPVTPPPGCIFPGWSLGYNIAVELDASGNPHVTHGARHICLNSDFTVRTNIEWARYTGFQQP